MGVRPPQREGFYQGDRGAQIVTSRIGHIASCGSRPVRASSGNTLQETVKGPSMERGEYHLFFLQHRRAIDASSQGSAACNYRVLSAAPGDDKWVSMAKRERAG